MDCTLLFLSTKYLCSLKARRYSTFFSSFIILVHTLRSAFYLELIFCVLYEIGLCFIFPPLTQIIYLNSTSLPQRFEMLRGFVSFNVWMDSSPHGFYFWYFPRCSCYLFFYMHFSIILSNSIELTCWYFYWHCLELIS